MCQTCGRHNPEARTTKPAAKPQKTKKTPPKKK